MQNGGFWNVIYTADLQGKIRSLRPYAYSVRAVHVPLRKNLLASKHFCFIVSYKSINKNEKNVISFGLSMQKGTKALPALGGFGFAKTPHAVFLLAYPTSPLVVLKTRKNKSTPDWVHFRLLGAEARFELTTFGL